MNKDVEKQRNLQRIIITHLDDILDQLEGILHNLHEIREIHKEYEKLKLRYKGE